MLIALALIFYKFMFHMTILQPAHLSAGKGGIKGPAPLLRRGLGLIRLPHPFLDDLARGGIIDVVHDQLVPLGMDQKLIALSGDLDPVIALGRQLGANSAFHIIGIGRANSQYQQ